MATVACPECRYNAPEDALRCDICAHEFVPGADEALSLGAAGAAAALALSPRSGAPAACQPAAAAAAVYTPVKAPAAPAATPTANATPVWSTGASSPTTPPPPRGYQARIASAVVDGNAVVVLPTGAGKTRIAAEVMARIGGRAVMFAPTVELVAQHQRELARWAPSLSRIEALSGGRTLPTHDVPPVNAIVATPAVFLRALQEGHALAQWTRFSVVVFDEVHHCTGEHPYHVLAKSLRASGCSPRVLALSASPTYKIGDEVGCGCVCVWMRACGCWCVRLIVRLFVVVSSSSCRRVVAPPLPSQ